MARAKKAPPPKYQDFVFHVRAPSVHYSFGIEHDRRRREWRPFDEHHTLDFVTECIWPDRFKAREGKATIYPEPDFLDHKLLKEDDVRRKWIGYLHQQGLDTSTSSGRAMFGMLGVFAEFERAMIRERIMSGLRRTSKRSGRKPMAEDRVQAIRKSLADGVGIRATARLHAASPMTVTRIAREMAPPEAVAA